MGRKIPSKKHRGVKDPAQQQAKRLQSLKGKINAPPKDPDEQPVPRSLTQLFAFRESKPQKQVKKKTHYQRGNPDQKNPHGNKNPISKLKKLPGESGRSFSLRINSAIKALHSGVEDNDYPLDMEDDEDVKGGRMEAQRRRRERKRKRTGGAGADDAPAPTRTQRLALKKQAKKQREAEAKQEKREVVYERVGFGEVAHAPPALVFKSKKANKGDGAPRPGRRDLLLSGMLETEASRGERLRRERLQLARRAAVDAYRALRHP